MATIQHSIEVNVPVRTLYNQLTQFEDYPLFWETIDQVHQVDDIHLHWTAKAETHLLEWDAHITEQKADHCIAWHAINEISPACKIEVQALSPYTSQAIFTLDAEPGKAPGFINGNTEKEMAQHLAQNLENLKLFVETLGQETGGWRGEIEDGNVTLRGRDAKDPVPKMTRQNSIASASGTPTEVLEDEPNEAGANTAYSKDANRHPTGKTQRGVAR